jgi:monoterpene epsilon-lactone hydrolase
VKQLDLPLRVAGRLTATLERPGLGGPLPLAAQRRWLDLVARALPEPDATMVHSVTLGGRPALRVSVGPTEQSRAVVHLHGGAYTVGSPRAYRSMAAYFAQAAGAVVYLPDYRLAPEYQHPAALADAVAACADVAGRHDSYGLSGDSAGGGLAVATALRLVDDGPATPSALTLASPWVDPTALSTGPTRDLILRQSWGLRCAASYLGAGDPHDPGFAPTYGRLDGLPPTLVHVGTDEVLYGQVTQFVTKLRAAGVAVELTEQRLWHVAHASAGVLREAREAVAAFGQFQRSH